MIIGTFLGILLVNPAGTGKHPIRGASSRYAYPTHTRETSRTPTNTVASLKTYYYTPTTPT
jgi:hypothetical protein